MKRAAFASNVSVVPGIDDLTARTLPAKANDESGLETIARAYQFDVSGRPSQTSGSSINFEL